MTIFFIIITIAIIYIILGLVQHAIVLPKWNIGYTSLLKINISSNIDEYKMDLACHRKIMTLISTGFTSAIQYFKSNSNYYDTKLLHSMELIIIQPDSAEVSSNKIFFSLLRFKKIYVIEINLDIKVYNKHFKQNETKRYIENELLKQYIHLWIKKNESKKEFDIVFRNRILNKFQVKK